MEEVSKLPIRRLNLRDGMAWRDEDGPTEETAIAVGASLMMKANGELEGTASQAEFFKWMKHNRTYYDGIRAEMENVRALIGCDANAYDVWWAYRYVAHYHNKIRSGTTHAWANKSALEAICKVPSAGAKVMLMRPQVEKLMDLFFSAVCRGYRGQICLEMAHRSLTRDKQQPKFVELYMKLQNPEHFKSDVVINQQNNALIQLDPSKLTQEELQEHVARMRKDLGAVGEIKDES